MPAAHSIGAEARSEGSRPHLGRLKVFLYYFR